MHRLTVQYFDPADGDAFLAAYRERHVPLVQAIPGLERFTLTTPRGDGAPYLVAELWFADRDAMKAGLSSPQNDAAAADAETYDVARKVMFTGEVEEIQQAGG
ncbi:EthD family reductase [Nocardioides sp. 503]|uniref:EthD family reductase n=1 Tax=Nocardioides sp. 503 TaxID=2508326 RepID=UPI00107036CD|nr:EthD family reductase [Nocardioides sp. 503]